MHLLHILGSAFEHLSHPLSNALQFAVNIVNACIMKDCCLMCYYFFHIVAIKRMSYGVMCFRNKLRLAWALGDFNRKFDMHLKVNRGNTHQRRYHPGRNYHWHKPYRIDPFHSCDTFHSFQLLHRKLKIQIIQLCNLLYALAYIILWKAIQITWTSYLEDSLMHIYLFTHVCVCLCKKQLLIQQLIS